MLSFPRKKLELLRTILKYGPIHIRGLISKTKTNPTLAVRYVNELVSKGILKEVETGTNAKKVDIDYDSDMALYLVAGICVMEREDFIRKHPDVKLLFRKMQKLKEVRVALVFGSHARGTESPESDVDVLVVSNRKRLSEEKFREELNLVEEGHKVSFIFETESEFRQNKNDAVHRSMKASYVIIKNPSEYLLSYA